MLSKILPPESVSVYIHVPFCVQKCRYCDFYSIENAGKEQVNKIISSTIDQLVYFITQLGNPLVSSVYIGGGTPSSIGLDATIRLFSAITDVLHLLQDVSDDFEFTVEVNPESLSAVLLKTYNEMGVNRLSVGAQTFSEEYSNLIGRVGSPKITRRALELIAERWNGRFSLDLISALPGQTIESGLYDVREALSYSPDHISLYTLTIEEGTPLNEDLKSGKIQAPGDSEIEVWEKQVHFLTDSGFDQYEISNFALPGCRSRHNMTYWHMLPYLGCGPAAVSTLPGAEGPLRIENNRSIDHFINHPARQTGIAQETDSQLNYGESYEYVTPGAFFLEHLMVGLRLTEGIDRSRMKSVFGIDPLIL